MMKGRNADSEHILCFVHENTVGAEIGVWKGETSAKFLTKNLKHLHLVDPWSADPYLDNWDHYSRRYEDVVGGRTVVDWHSFYDELHQKVKNKFESNDVTVHRMFSTEFFKTLEDNTLDWIYIDGDHGYEGCLSDLNQARRVVKSTGEILGDDYPNKKGVVKAVDEFVQKENLKLDRYGPNQFRIRNS